MKVNRILLAMLGNRGIPVPRPDEASALEKTIEAHMKASDPDCRLRTAWNARETTLDIRSVTLPTGEGGARLSYRRDGMESDETRHVITIVDASEYPVTVGMALAGRALDDVVRHPDINGLGLRIDDARRLAAGGLIMHVTHADGMLMEAS